VFSKWLFCFVAQTTILFAGYDIERDVRLVLVASPRGRTQNQLLGIYHSAGVYDDALLPLLKSDGVLVLLAWVAQDFASN
jgi:hypothetical protein